MLKPSYKKDIYASDFPAKGSRLAYGTSGLGGVWGEIDEGEIKGLIEACRALD